MPSQDPAADRGSLPVCRGPRPIAVESGCSGSSHIPSSTVSSCIFDRASDAETIKDLRAKLLIATVRFNILTVELEGTKRQYGATLNELASAKELQGIHVQLTKHRIAKKDESIQALWDKVIHMQERLQRSEHAAQKAQAEAREVRGSLARMEARVGALVDGIMLAESRAAAAELDAYEAAIACKQAQESISRLNHDVDPPQLQFVDCKRSSQSQPVKPPSFRRRSLACAISQPPKPAPVPHPIISTTRLKPTSLAPPAKLSSCPLSQEGRPQAHVRPSSEFLQPRVSRVSESLAPRQKSHLRSLSNASSRRSIHHFESAAPRPAADAQVASEVSKRSFGPTLRTSSSIDILRAHLSGCSEPSASHKPAAVASVPDISAKNHSHPLIYDPQPRLDSCSKEKVNRLKIPAASIPSLPHIPPLPLPPTRRVALRPSSTVPKKVSKIRELRYEARRIKGDSSYIRTHPETTPNPQPAPCLNNESPPADSPAAPPMKPTSPPPSPIRPTRHLREQSGSSTTKKASGSNIRALRYEARRIKADRSPTCPPSKIPQLQLASFPLNGGKVPAPPAEAAFPLLRHRTSVPAKGVLAIRALRHEAGPTEVEDSPPAFVSEDVQPLSSPCSADQTSCPSILAKPGSPPSRPAHCIPQVPVPTITVKPSVVIGLGDALRRVSFATVKPCIEDHSTWGGEDSAQTGSLTFTDNESRDFRQLLVEIEKDVDELKALGQFYGATTSISTGPTSVDTTLSERQSASISVDQAGASFDSANESYESPILALCDLFPAPPTTVGAFASRPSTCDVLSALPSTVETFTPSPLSIQPRSFFDDWSDDGHAIRDNATIKDGTCPPKWSLTKLKTSLSSMFSSGAGDFPRSSASSSFPSGSSSPIVETDEDESMPVTPCEGAHLPRFHPLAEGTSSRSKSRRHGRVFDKTALGLTYLTVLPFAWETEC